jgi:thymidylate kinase
MIIELFGPPGAGKTTFAHALTRRLRESDHVVELSLSYRPAERPSSPDLCSSDSAQHRVAAVARRLSRPFLEMLAIASHPLALSHDIGAAAGLMRILPPRNMGAAIRLSQYILRLSHAWYHASAARHIVLFDQAFVQVVCSLALLGRVADDGLIERALDSSPKSDLLIGLDAPPEILTERLRNRESKQSAVERLFELDMETNLNAVRIIDRLHDLLRNRDQLVMRASSIDQRSLCESVDHIEKQLAVMFRAERRAFAS